jgi:hypothetical protein
VGGSCLDTSIKAGTYETVLKKYEWRFLEDSPIVPPIQLHLPVDHCLSVRCSITAATRDLDRLVMEGFSVGAIVVVVCSASCSHTSLISSSAR